MSKENLLKKITNIKEYLSVLKTYADISVEDIIFSIEKTATVERYFQLLVDEAIDINTQLIFSKTNSAPDTYKASFYELITLGVLDESFVTKISTSVSIRNRIVHDYEKIQKKMLLEEIKKLISIYEEYLVKVINFVERI